MKILSRKQPLVQASISMDWFRFQMHHNEAKSSRKALPFSAFVWIIKKNPRLFAFTFWFNGYLETLLQFTLKIVIYSVLVCTKRHSVPKWMPKQDKKKRRASNATRSLNGNWWHCGYHVDGRFFNFVLFAE